jgi:GT2 family glycosyltransferase
VAPSRAPNVSGAGVFAVQPLLSIVIATYNCEAHVRACLASLDQERSLIELEVIVVDNASTDRTAETVRNFPWVKLMVLPNNAGFSHACNVGYEAAKGRHVLMLNPDTVVPPGGVARTVEEFENRPEVGMLGVKLVQLDGTLDHACKRGFPSPLGALSHFVGLNRFVRAGKFGDYVAAHTGDDETTYIDAINGAFMLLRREAVEQVGLLDENYWLYMEDLDWCFRFWQSGWKILYWPQVEILHVKGGSSGKRRSWKTNVAFHRGMWRFYAKFYRSRSSALTNAVVFAGIHGKLGLSGVRSYVWRIVATAVSRG